MASICAGKQHALSTWLAGADARADLLWVIKRDTADGCLRLFLCVPDRANYLFMFVFVCLHIVYGMFALLARCLLVSGLNVQLRYVAKPSN